MAFTKSHPRGGKVNNPHNITSLPRLLRLDFHSYNCIPFAPITCYTFPLNRSLKMQSVICCGVLWVKLPVYRLRPNNSLLRLTSSFATGATARAIMHVLSSIYSWSMFCVFISILTILNWEKSSLFQNFIFLSRNYKFLSKQISQHFN